MRKPRDYDSELKAISERAKQLQERKLRQLGQLVVATGADALPIEVLAGALIAAQSVNAAAKGDWGASGAAFFQRRSKAAAGAPSGNTSASAPSLGSAASLDGAQNSQ